MLFETEYIFVTGQKFVGGSINLCFLNKKLGLYGTKRTNTRHSLLFRFCFLQRVRGGVGTRHTELHCLPLHPAVGVVKAKDNLVLPLSGCG